jgi:hypothetical protein
MAASYYFRMSNVKTTVYLDAADYRRLKALAPAEGCPIAELIRAAVSEYARRHGPAALPSSLGIGTSGDCTLSERVEELLTGLGGPFCRKSTTSSLHGWGRPRRSRSEPNSSGRSSSTQPTRTCGWVW